MSTICMQDGVERRVRRVVAAQRNKRPNPIDPEKIDIDATYDSLGLDILDDTEITMALEREFGFDRIPDEIIIGLTTLRKTVDYIEFRLSPKARPTSVEAEARVA